jgi:urease accessory protein
VIEQREHQVWRGHLKLSFVPRRGRTVLERREHMGPLLVQRALYPEGPGVCHAVILHPPGGVAQGDELRVEAELYPGARALLTTPGATKWYRSGGAWATSSLDFELCQDAVLEWLPRESIVFDGARIQNRLLVRLSPAARFLGWEIYCFGRCASGEHFATGRADLASRIERQGKPLWLEVGSLDPATGFLGTFVVAGTAVSDSVMTQCREIGIPTPNCRYGITRMPDLWIARYLGHSSESAFSWFASLWGVLRPRVLGLTPVPPRIWAC